MIVRHTFEPVYDKTARVLIVGSMPSVLSREGGFYYGNPRNRFYDVMSAVLGCEKPHTVEAKKRMLLQNRIALYDVLRECEISGSADSSIKNAQPNDFSPIFKAAGIRRVFANGKAAYGYYRKYIGGDIACLPSTSPANAAYGIEKLVKEWSQILEYLRG